DRALRFHWDVQEVRRLLKRCRAVRNDEPGWRIGRRQERVNAIRELQPFLGADRRAADLQHVFAGELRELARLRNALEHLSYGELLADVGIERVVEPVRTDAGDAAAGAQNMDSRPHQGTRITLPKKSRESTTRCASAACASGNASWMMGFSLPSATRPITLRSSSTGAFFEPARRSSLRKNGMMSNSTTSPAWAPTVTMMPPRARHWRLRVKTSPPMCSMITSTPRPPVMAITFSAKFSLL